MTRVRPVLHGLALALALAALQSAPLGVSGAAAQAAGEADAAKPWAQGVSREDQQVALAAFNEGNEYFAERRHAEALTRYRKAVERWEHPAIHFNMTVCFIHMDEPIEALEHLERALAYGEAPLGASLYAEGLTYRKLLNDRLGRLTVVASQAQAEVTLDGGPLLVAPGEVTRLILPGRHQIVATLSGYVTHTQMVNVLPGEPQEVKVELVTVEDATELERPMAVWLPWTVMGSGLAVAAVGLGLRVAATHKLDAYDEAVADLCPQGCTASELPDSVADDEAAGEALDRAALATMIAGGAAFVTGLTLLLLNQPRPVEHVVESAAIRVLPSVHRGGSRVDLWVSF